MRPVRVTGVTGTSAWVPLDTYSPGRASATLNSAGAPTLEMTLDNPFDTSITPHPEPVTAHADGHYEIPAGARAVRGLGMIAADILTVSQQGIA